MGSQYQPIIKWYIHKIEHNDFLKKKIVSIQIMSISCGYWPKGGLQGDCPQELAPPVQTGTRHGENWRSRLCIWQANKWHMTAFVSIVKVSHHTICMLHNTVTFSLCWFYVQLKISVFFNPFMQRQKLFCFVRSKCRDPLHSFDNLGPWCAWLWGYCWHHRQQVNHKVTRW